MIVLGPVEQITNDGDFIRMRPEEVIQKKKVPTDTGFVYEFFCSIVQLNKNEKAERMAYSLKNAFPNDTQKIREYIKEDYLYGRNPYWEIVYGLLDQ